MKYRFAEGALSELIEAGGYYNRQSPVWVIHLWMRLKTAFTRFWKIRVFSGLSKIMFEGI